MSTNNTTFWNLINSNKISIPIIQRDYAQGREEESGKREKFLNAIFTHLNNNEKLHLDFVYGRVKDNTFFPIDGQQRLTTLFLLHWYFAIKEKEIVSNEEKSKLSQFVYDTRISSREFCQSLIKEDIELPLKTGDDVFIKAIKNKFWYRDKWDTDPTVKAMLVMIQAIHNKFSSISSSSVFEQLTSKEFISFELLDLGKKGFELTDELYIKMNARGKQLNPFETFKANFIQLIDKYFKDKKLEHPIKGKISYSGYFSYKIEKEWTDLFWNYRGDKETTDEIFSNYFEYITQMLFFKGYSLTYTGNENDISELLKTKNELLLKIIKPAIDEIRFKPIEKEKQKLISTLLCIYVGNKANNIDFINLIKNDETLINDSIDLINEENLTETIKANLIAKLNPQIQFKKTKDVNAEDFLNNLVQYDEVYVSEENLLFLFNSLDKLYDIFCIDGVAKKDNLNNFFDSIEDISTFFWNTKKDSSLFEGIILNNKNEDIRNKILFFSIIHYLIKHKISTLNNQLENYVRIIRNLLQATRQRNETKYNTDVRINRFGSYWILFEQLSSADVYNVIQDPTLNNKNTRISDYSLNNEIEKVKILQSKNSIICSSLIGLEEIENFGGLIHQLKPELNQSKLQNYLQVIKEIWSNSISDTLRIQALIACGFDGLYIKDTKMGKTYYFGKKENWSIILTNDKDEISKSILSLLDTYINIQVPETDKKLQAIVDEWLITNKTDRSYKYYFLKYPEFTSKLNYFVWPNDYEIRILGTESSNPLIAYHINPFVLNVCRIINNKNICDENQCYLQYSGNSPLTLINGLTMTSTIDGWLIPIDPIINDSIILKYGLILIEDNYLLKDNDKMDRIEIAVDFINDILK